MKQKDINVKHMHLGKGGVAHVRQGFFALRVVIAAAQ